MMDVMKFGSLGMVSMLSTVITAHTLGEVVDKLIGWFDDWTNGDKIAQEGSTDNGRDLDGTSLKNDLLYHSITTVYTWVVFVAIMVGGNVFAYNFSGFYPV